MSEDPLLHMTDKLVESQRGLRSTLERAFLRAFPDHAATPERVSPKPRGDGWTTTSRPPVLVLGSSDDRVWAADVNARIAEIEGTDPPPCLDRPTRVTTHFAYSTRDRKSVV